MAQLLVPRVRPLVLLVSLVFSGASAYAGFSINAKPLPARSAPEVQPAKAVTGSVRLTVPKGTALKTAVVLFAADHGWNVAWLAGDVMSTDLMTFDGADHEIALSAFLRHYKLQGDRYPEEKGYVIRAIASPETTTKKEK